MKTNSANIMLKLCENEIRFQPPKMLGVIRNLFWGSEAGPLGWSEKISKNILKDSWKIKKISRKSFIIWSLVEAP